jgi:DnaK suppressor protein
MTEKKKNRKTIGKDQAIEAELTRLESRLLRELQTRLSNVRNVSADDPTEFLDMASEGEVDYMSAISAEAGSDTVREIQHALRKLHEGSYGVCEECERKISKRRLQARPFAVLCIDCKAEQERRRYSESTVQSYQRGQAPPPELMGEEETDYSGRFNDVLRDLDDIELREMF